MKEDQRIIFVEKCEYGKCPYFDYDALPEGMIVGTICRHTESPITSRLPGQDFPDLCPLKIVRERADGMMYTIVLMETRNGKD